jgi:sulfite reductase (NADPH) flavoprotein alpha-component
LTYTVGDSLAVFGTHDPELVQKTLIASKAAGNEMVADRHTGEPYTFREYLTRKANITDISRRFVAELAQRQTDPQKKKRLLTLLDEEQKEELREYLATHEVWDALEENAEVDFSPQELCHLLSPLLPRFYSIASSMKTVQDEAHLTVAELQYETNGHIRRGVCTHYLCRLAPMHQKVIPIYVQPNANGFTVPENPAAAIIMVGPGTGVASFRAFMQEREATSATGMNWLFFGEWHRNYEFFYEKEWRRLMSEGKLRLETAFSRDQPHKVYVQHRMLEHGEELFRLLEQGAYFYVCGDARRMAKDVDATLHRIVEIHGQLDEQQAKQYVKKLKAEKRYLRDIY